MDIPRSTYRLQFREGMTFDRASALVPYLKRLGISHLYASPIFTAANGSTHGYDVADANEIDPTLGGRDGFERLAAALHAAGLGLILDIVPNHMAASLEAPWWRSVVEWGNQSPFARHFDIDWNRKLTLPILGKPLEEILGSRELSLAVDAEAGALTVAYFDNLIPLNPASYAGILSQLPVPLASEIATLASRADPRGAAEFHDELKELVCNNETTLHLQNALADLSARHDVLRRILEVQPWQLLGWKEAASKLSYRRFFEVTGLVGLRVEDPAVFADSHRLTFDLVRGGLVDGLRIDHIDGLVDPREYLERLGREVGSDVYIIVEKILAEGEQLPPNWPISGTTGYEFISALSHVFINSDLASDLDQAYGEIAVDQPGFAAGIRKAKMLLIEHNLAVEANNLLKLLAGVAGLQGDKIDERSLRDALCKILVAFPTYRTYGTTEGLNETDAALWSKVLFTAANRSEAPDGRTLAFVDKVFKSEVSTEAREKAAEFRRRFQQLTGPLSAKAIEDTMFYRFNRLIALNEVGGEPTGRETSLQRFHQAMTERARTQPHGLSATSTHDTKRGEDTRARLYSISEAPASWRDAVKRWRRMNAEHVTHLGDGPAPEPEVEWLLYQALAGVWPADLGEFDLPGDLEARFLAYIEKSLREAKLRTNWGIENGDYEAAVKAYGSNLLSPDNSPFLADFSKTITPFIRAGLFNGLAQTLIKLTAPGIPDIYQGSETLDLSLVDPDNRRIPDFASLARKLETSGLTQDEQALHDGALKQRLIALGLALRNAEPTLFSEGRYRPLEAIGDRSDQIVAFLREADDAVAVTVAPRFLLGLGNGEWPCRSYWGNCSIAMPDGIRTWQLTNIVDGATFEAGDPLPTAALLDLFPVALLVGKR
ncbi:malto-oligosyltrehalose synthase [Rhizobium tubonense]|uniref:Malto-oligosyltrehalose synthase n=1 Tax=Rhizobium tubonense TaxID=484088 RepID=A0A2W4ELQ0_9HYPH|nr:malto-oligosyltrehalose synthase [Rhizobium tubonense]PZM14686.1 malto-oligosyltrehalose synthase [Rhizobium tubonense]